ncbi:Calx-beta domain-containing protein [Candidatus Palauibacter polyketidifaciens]|uniref:Calx-beta domain-containing protein n=1 Tax=Candidatus Palauibacter polyketidifaciens TaxID=3056740 RepID=UPI0023864532|nr:Calx-beta domain-containing protein [Candidatus Palauibacter polyketidifaciens]MDE2719307.1 hypothetical protein [Candidatus Palauibacter polyketidifaciens]
MNTSQPIQRRARLSGPGHGALTVILAACAALFGGRATAFAQTDADDANTIWSATMIVGDTTWTSGAITVNEQGFYEGALGSLSSTTFSHGNADYSVVKLPIRQFTVGEYVSRPALSFRVRPGVFPAASEDRLVLVLDGTRFPLASRPSHQVNYYAWQDPGLSWSDGDTVDVKLIDDAPPPLTASFSGMPDAHTGAEFTFRLTFSEEVENLGSATLIDAFDVTGGTVKKAKRTLGGYKVWKITVAPTSASDTVAITLPETTDCSAAGAICTADLRPLSHSLTGAVTPSTVVPSASVSDASATEGRWIGFTVSLSEATSRTVTVAYATSGGTATSGTDFTPQSGTLTFTANQTEKPVAVATTEDTMVEEDETFTLTLSSPTNATLGDATATGTIIDDDALTATFSDMPATHTGAEFTFVLTFSEDFPLSYKTLRDSAAFAVTGGGVKRAQRRPRGSSSNKAWTITIEPASANDTVTITLPETTDCNATGAICTADGRMLSEAVSDTVLPASASGDMAGADAEDGALALLDGVTPDRAAAALVGEGEQLSEAQLDALDRLGNRNGRYDLGDALSWRDRCRRGEADCGTTPRDPGAAASGLLLFGAARRRRRGTSGHRRTPRAGHALAVLVAAITVWSCTGDLAGPPEAGREPDPLPAPATVPQGPGFLTVEWTAPAAGRAIGVLLELEGPGIEAVEAPPGLELYHSAASGRHRIVVAGDLDSGPLLRFRVPDRGRPGLYRVRVLQVTGEDYGLRDSRAYRAVAAPN